MEHMNCLMHSSCRLIPPYKTIVLKVWDNYIFFYFIYIINNYISILLVSMCDSESDHLKASLHRAGVCEWNQQVLGLWTRAAVPSVLLVTFPHAPLPLCLPPFSPRHHWPASAPWWLSRVSPNAANPPNMFTHDLCFYLPCLFLPTCFSLVALFCVLDLSSSPFPDGL